MHTHTRTHAHIRTRTRILPSRKTDYTLHCNYHLQARTLCAPKISLLMKTTKGAMVTSTRPSHPHSLAKGKRERVETKGHKPSFSSPQNSPNTKWLHALCVRSATLTDCVLIKGRSDCLCFTTRRSLLLCPEHTTSSHLFQISNTFISNKF